MRRKLKEWYVVEKAAMVIYLLGVVGIVIFVVQGEWLRAGVTAALVLSMWAVAIAKAIREARRWDEERARYERLIADKQQRSNERIVRHHARIQRRRNHR
jgi:predicted ferric reductase